MGQDHSSNHRSARSWFARLSQTLLGEPRDQEQLIALLRDAEQRELFDGDLLKPRDGAGRP